MEKDEYKDAWSEGEDGPIEDAVQAAGKKAQGMNMDEYLAAYKELDDEDEEDKADKDAKK